MSRSLIQAAARSLCLALLATGLASCGARHEAADSNLEISAVYIAEPVLGERTAMYFTVENRGSLGDDLTAVSTSIAEAAEIHRTVSDGGMMRMEPVESVRVPAGAEVHLAPGGYHVMLLELKEHIGPGDYVEATLHFRRAGEVPVRARVISLPSLERVLETTGEGGQQGNR